MLRREAAGWLARLQSRRDPEVERKFRTWHDADPAHAAAFARVSRSYEQAGLLRQSNAPVAGAGHAPGGNARTPGYVLAAAAAAAAVVILVPAAMIAAGNGAFFGSTNAVMLVTRVGEIRRVALKDGSHVTLDTGTSLSVEVGPSRRRAELKAGRARFEVAPADTPFVVEAGSATVTSGGSVFDVERAGKQSRVDVLSGSASVEDDRTGGAPALQLQGGQSAAALPSGIQAAHPAPAVGDWTRGMLDFNAMPLGSAVALANRYSEQKIVVAPEVASLRVTGAFRAGDTVGLARALASAFGLSLRTGADGTMTLSPGERNDPLKKNGG